MNRSIDLRGVWDPLENIGTGYGDSTSNGSLMNWEKGHDHGDYKPWETRSGIRHIFCHGLIESMMGLRQRQGNLRLVSRLFSLMRGLPSIRLK